MASPLHLMEERQSNLSSFPSTPTHLPIVWRREAQQLHSIGIASDAATVFINCANALESAIQEAGGAFAVVTISEGARRSGYSTRQLSRLVKRGDIRNFGNETRPKIAIGDLPRKSGMARTL